MKKIISVFLMLALAASVFAQKKTKYISPNSDGIQDELEIPLKISDKRFVESWSLIIMDENRNPVRTIGNKVALPEKVGFRSFFKQLVSVKQGIPVPEKVIWNGALDSGETAPDGLYYYYFTAKDDNGNEGRTKEYAVVVDTVAPEIELSQPGDRIFGEGAKSSFKIRQEGSKEDLWTGTFKSSDGTVVKIVQWTDEEPAEFSWYGTDDNGAQVADGVYSYEITATDRAGNKAPYSTIQNIIYSAEKPATNIFVEGSRYFSPKTASGKSTVIFNITIPVPEEKTGNSLTDWAVTVYNEKENAVRVYNKANTGDIPPSHIEFDGTDANGKQLADGNYQAKVTASYRNGYVPAVISSPVIILDTENPNMDFVVSDKVFGSGNKRSVEIGMKISSKQGAPIPFWKGSIVSVENGKTVKSYDFGEFPPESISWSGIADDGTLAEKGEYKFVVAAEDMAGNKGVQSPSSTFSFDTTEASLLLAASDSAFSPNGDKVQDVMTFTPVSAQSGNVTKYNFKIISADGTEVFKKDGTKLPSSIVWNGKDGSGILCADGIYSAILDIETANGSPASASTGSFALDTVAPSLIAETPWTDFSPDGDGNQDNIPVQILECSSEKSWVCDIRNAKKEVVKKITWNGQIRNFEWDGTDESGNVALDGVYTMAFTGRDEAGNSFSTEIINLTLDNRETKIYLISENEGISPNGDGVLDNQCFEIKASVTENIISWKFDIRKEDGTSVRSWSEKDQTDLPGRIIWDGYNNEGSSIQEGTFTGTLAVTYKKGNRVSTVSSPFICTATAPQLRVQTAPDYFSPDNDGVDDDLFIKLTGTTMAKIKNWSFTIDDPKGRPFWTTSGKSQITERMIWDGLSNVQKNKNGKAESVQSAMDYPYTFTVTDNLGMTSTVSGVIPVDVLVIREGSVLKMAVPSIIFLSDDSVFQEAQKTLTQEQVDKNLQVLNRIADILKKFKDYKVTIVGHANRTSDNLEEETLDNPRVWGRALTPLSTERAEAIKKYLVKKGVNASSISTDGKGGTEPVADPKDKDNNWKNRRVEFILQK